MRAISPKRTDSRTSAALGLEGRGFFTWQLRGIRELAVAPAVEQVWQGSTAFPTLRTTASNLTIDSDTATDISPAGVGARSAAIVYLNSKFEIRLGVAKFAGVAQVDVLEFNQVTQSSGALVLDAIRVLAVNISEVGSTGVNNGRIDTKIGGDLQARIIRPAAVVSQGMMNSARPGFTVPSGFVALVDSFYSSGPYGGNILADTVKVALQARPPRQPFRGVMAAGGDFSNMHAPDPQAFPAATDLRIVYEVTKAPPDAGHYVQPQVSLYLYPDRDTADTNPLQIPRLNRCGFGVDP